MACVDEGPADELELEAPPHPVAEVEPKAQQELPLSLSCWQASDAPISTSGRNSRNACCELGPDVRGPPSAAPGLAPELPEAPSAACEEVDPSGGAEGCGEAAEFSGNCSLIPPSCSLWSVVTFEPVASMLGLLPRLLLRCVAI